MCIMCQAARGILPPNLWGTYQAIREGMAYKQNDGYLVVNMHTRGVTVFPLGQVETVFDMLKGMGLEPGTMSYNLKPFVFSYAWDGNRKV